MTTRAVLALVSILCGFTLLHPVDVAVQMAMLSVIERIAPVVFGILGVWIAVLDPTVILSYMPSRSPDKREELALKFSPLLLDATLVFVGVVTLAFVQPALPTAWLHAWWAKAILGSLITFFYLSEMAILLRTLMPVLDSIRKDREDRARRRLHR